MNKFIKFHWIILFCFSFYLGQNFDQEEIRQNSLVNRLDSALTYFFTILKNRNEDFFKVRNSNLVLFFNGHFSITKSKKFLLDSNEYRSTVVCYFNESLLKDYQDQIGIEDYSEDPKNPKAFISMLNFEEFEIHKSSYSMNLSFYKGLSFLLKFNYIKEEDQLSKTIKYMRKGFKFIETINNIIDWILLWLGFDYNCGSNDYPIILGIGILNRIVHIKNAAYGNNIPSLIQLSDKLFWCFGFSIHMQLIDSRLNLNIMNKTSDEKKTKEEYKLSKDYYKFNIYKPIWNCLSFLGFKFNFLYTPSKSQWPMMELIILYKSYFDCMCHFLTNINQSKHKSTVRLLQTSPILRAALI